jgi:hypothetical protein
MDERAMSPPTSASVRVPRCSLRVCRGTEAKLMSRGDHRLTGARYT